MGQIESKAFTLIEILVVIAIILLTIAFGVPAFNKYGNNAEVSSTAEQIQATIEKAYSNSNTPPQGANEIHLWFMKDGALGQVVFARAYYQPRSEVALAQTDDPSNSSAFSAEIVTIPDYMLLTISNSGPDKIYCRFLVAGEQVCKNTVRGNDMGSPFELILSSDKTDLEYRIIISENPFRVVLNAENN